MAKAKTTTARPASRTAGRSAAAASAAGTPRQGRTSQPASRAVAPNEVPAQRWLVITSFVLAILGLAVSIYLTIDHYTSIAPLACPENATINCVKVTTSTYSKLAGVPVALLGLLFYVAMVVLCSPWLWRARQAWLTQVRIGAASTGVLFVFYLIWAELFQIQAICLWCTSVHVITVALFAVLLIGQALRSAAAFKPAT
jgi:uncharacterized membrane protein